MNKSIDFHLFYFLIILFYFNSYLMKSLSFNDKKKINFYL